MHLLKKDLFVKNNWTFGEKNKRSIYTAHSSYTRVAPEPLGTDVSCPKELVTHTSSCKQIDKKNE